MPRRLLIADDAMIIRQIIKDMAVSAGWEVVGEASNGQEAIERYRELHPDAVTLDLVMPEHDGLHALHGIMEFDSEAKVLVVSALEQRGVLKDAIKAGACRFRRQAVRQTEPAGHPRTVGPAKTRLDPVSAGAA